MSRYAAYLEKVARNREQFSRAQRAYDSQVPPCVEDQPEDDHPEGCICPDCYDGEVNEREETP